jgi:hypothetical protein
LPHFLSRGRLKQRAILLSNAPYNRINLVLVPSRSRNVKKLLTAHFVAHLLLDHTTCLERLLVLGSLFGRPLRLLEAVVSKHQLLRFNALLFVLPAPHGSLSPLIVASLCHKCKLQFAL